MPSEKKYFSNIHEAVKHGDVIELQRMIQQGADINGVDPKFKFSALHWAAHYGSLECLHWLLWHDADLHHQTNEGWTPSHIAAIRGRSTCLQALASNGANMGFVDARGKTVAHLAAAHGNTQTLQEILRKGVDLEARDHIGWTVFHTAAFHGRLGCLQLLIKWECKTDTLDLNGNTAAHLAAGEGHIPCLKFLIASSPNIERVVRARNDQGDTPRDIANQHLKSNCIEYLNGIEYDIDHPEVSENMAFPAHNSSYKGDIEYLQMVIETGVASVNERDEKGSTPAHKAAGNGQVEVLKWLIEKGANINLMNSTGETPRDVALRFGQLACVKILGGESDDESEEVEEMIPDETQIKAEAKGRAQRKITELAEQLEIAKLNFQQLGGVLEEDKKKLKQEQECSRKIRELESLLEYERVKREKLEAQLDKMRLHIHKLNLQLEDAQSRIPVTPPFRAEEELPPKQVKKKKKKKSVQPGIFLVQRNTGSYKPLNAKSTNLDGNQVRPASASYSKTSNNLKKPTPPNRPRTAVRHRASPATADSEKSFTTIENAIMWEKLRRKEDTSSLHSESSNEEKPVTPAADERPSSTTMKVATPEPYERPRSGSASSRSSSDSEEIIVDD
ncbi:ankyrin repeat domain-containing protein 42-like [Hydractinia symbiolongicarpus]|uniref:ankyrin repeat domain-containing protein 42-like n=1 Tax=Hydractinia symbiolongicarpus TaxID=13093 RepID=UPI00254F76EF|nr:ankyrin repeat domain-containing protein 42-like [Hydractinia symbiolongicarpus]